MEKMELLTMLMESHTILSEMGKTISDSMSITWNQIIKKLWIKMLFLGLIWKVLDV